MADARSEFFELGTKTALLCDDSASLESLKQTFEEMGYKFHEGENPERAIERSKYTGYNILVIHENFGGASLETNLFLQYVATLPMAVRRTWFILLIGPSFRTFDAMQAFAQSVHLVVNDLDLNNLKAILTRSLADFEGFNRVYLETMAALGER